MQVTALMIRRATDTAHLAHVSSVVCNDTEVCKLLVKDYNEPEIEQKLKARLAL